MHRHRNKTFSLSQELIQELHLFVKKSFIEEGLLNDLKRQKSSREQQYIEAAKDKMRNKIFNEWEQLSGEGLNDQNEW